MIPLFLRKTFEDRGTWILPVTAFMMTSAIWFIVLGGARYLMSIPGENGLMYGTCAVLALLLLVIPMAALMSSAGRLMARQRDRRLSTLRLLGASKSQLRAVSVAEASVLASAGIALGVILYLLLSPLVGLVHFNGDPIGASGLWMGPGLLIVGILALLALAVGSSLLGLSRVHITPLSVRSRTTPRRVRRTRLIVAVVVFLLAQVMIAAVGGLAGAFILIFLVLAMVVPLLGINFLGPLVLKWVATRQAKKARTAVTLIAARNVLESPQEMWRQVGGVGFSIYLAVVAGSGMAMISAGSGPNARPEEVMLNNDIQTGVILALVISFVMVAASVSINQTAQVLDRRELYVALSRVGMSIADQAQIRQLSVMRSLLTVMIITVAIACVTAAPIVGGAMLMSPLTLLVILAVLLAGIGIVWVATVATTPTLRRVVQA
ncbi:FtsX-like permease family protein [Curtobacterium sp. S6]|uniref:FtsX-like permease family protein n=1 Tax=Curtobacterium sp. S6 TaxID=1479623 RepID=UPI0004AB8434|nr:FtsX-like permease family protein [Curtobacterium sp. S6]